MITARCFMDCTGEPIVDGKPIRFAYRRGLLYEIDPEAVWAIWFEDPDTGKRIKEPPAPKVKSKNVFPHKGKQRKLRETVAEV